MTNAGPAKLQKALGFWTLTAFGVGDILGAGIYALVGEVAGIAGAAAHWSFLTALGVASLTALSYAELGSRFPRCGSEAYYARQAFENDALGILIGWLVLCSGVVSMATVSHGFSRYVLDLFALESQQSTYLIILVFLLVLAGINYWGIRQSSAMNVLCTLVELSGLLIVIVLGSLFLVQGKATGDGTTTAIAGEPWTAIAMGASLAFFAFIGFEDMVNVAEEVKDPERNLPAAILTALALAGCLYVLVVWIAVSVVPPTELAQAQVPLSAVIRVAAPGFPVGVFTVIALFAVSNTALLNSITGSRLLYGMAEQRLLPSWLASIDTRTKTPYRSTAVIFAVGLLLALCGTLVDLAGTTSALLLIVFFTINVSLVVIRFRSGDTSHKFRIPIVLPVLGALFSLSLIAFTPWRSKLASAGIVAAGIVLVMVWTWMNRTRQHPAK